MPLLELIKNLKIFKFEDLNLITDPLIKGSLKLALQDLDPIPILKKCKNILVGYYPTILGQSEGIYS